MNDMINSWEQDPIKSFTLWRHKVMKKHEKVCHVQLRKIHPICHHFFKKFHSNFVFKTSVEKLKFSYLKWGQIKVNRGQKWGWNRGQSRGQNRDQSRSNRGQSGSSFLTKNRGQSRSKIYLIRKLSIWLFLIAICKIVLDIFRSHLRIFVLLPILTDKYKKIPMTEFVPHLYLK